MKKEMEKLNKKILKLQEKLERYQLQGIDWYRIYFYTILALTIASVLVGYACFITGMEFGKLQRIERSASERGFSENFYPRSSSDAGLALSPLEKYCLWDESRDDMSKIGKEYEVGALQFKVPTWMFLAEKYNFEGSICSRTDQIKLFREAVEGGDGNQWTCYRKYKNRD